MKKSNIILVIAFTLMTVGFFLMGLSESYPFIVFEQGNMLFHLSNNVTKFIWGSSISLTLATFSLLWKKHWLDCYENLFIEKSDFYIYLFMTFFFCLMPFIFITSLSYIYINGVFDRSPSYQIQNVVIDKYKHQGNKSGMTYTLVLKNQQNLIYLPVKADEYEQIHYDDNVIITAKTGFLNVPWRENYKIILHS